MVVEDDLERSRLTVFLRLILAIPHLIWITLWGIAVFFVAILSWFVVLITGRLPQGLRNFSSAFVRYSTHLYAYLYLAANPYPGFVGEPAAIRSTSRSPALDSRAAGRRPFGSSSPSRRSCSRALSPASASGGSGVGRLRREARK